MGLFRKPEVRSTNTYTTKDPELAQLLGIDIGGLSDNAATEATYYTCLRVMSDSISKLPLMLHQETDNGVSKGNGHYLYELLKLRPNPYMSSSSFWKMVEYQRNEYGFSVVYIDTKERGRHAGRVRALYPLDMSKVTIYYDNAGIINKENAIWYVYQDDNGNEYKFKDDKALRFVGMTPNGITGMPVRQYLKTLVENAQSGQQFVNNYFKGGLFAKGLLQYTADIPEGKEKGMRERFERMSSGIKNAGKILPVPVGFNFQPINSSMVDAQFLELNQLTMQQIAAAFGVKMHQINSLDRATHSNIYQQQKEFYVDTLQPILEMYEQEMTYKLLTQKEKEQGYFIRFNVDSILRSSPKERAEYLQLMANNGFISRNEGRKYENYPRIDHPNADTLIMNGNAIPIDKVGDQYSNPSNEGGENIE